MPAVNLGALTDAQLNAMVADLVESIGKTLKTQSYQVGARANRRPALSQQQDLLAAASQELERRGSAANAGTSQVRFNSST